MGQGVKFKIWKKYGKKYLNKMKRFYIKFPIVDTLRPKLTWKTHYRLILPIKNKNVEFKLVAPIAIFGVIAAIFGSFLANYLSSEILRKVFGIFLLSVGSYEVYKGYKSPKKGCQK